MADAGRGTQRGQRRKAHDRVGHGQAEHEPVRRDVEKDVVCRNGGNHDQVFRQAHETQRAVEGFRGDKFTWRKNCRRIRGRVKGGEVVVWPGNY